MRRLAVATLLVVPLLAACGTAPPPASIEIRPAMPQPDPEDDNPLGLRIWSLEPEVVVRFRRACDGADVRSSAQTWLNRRRAAWGGGDGSEHEQRGRVRRGSVVTLRPQLDAYAGQSVRLRVRVRCSAGTATAAATTRMPAASCDNGFLHLYELRGRAEWEDDRGEGDPRWRPLRAGDLVESEDRLRVVRGGRAVVGAAECNGFRLELRSGIYEIGGYLAGARGEAFGGTNAVVEGDAHAGVWESGGLDVAPLGSRCRGCESVAPTIFEVRHGRVRVTAGSVVASAGGHRAIVRGGEQAGAACIADTCRLVGARIFQPDEPWSTPLAGSRTRLRPFARGTPPPRRALAPPFSRVDVHPLPAHGGAPDQLAVRWSRQLRTKPDVDPEEQGGVLIWQRVASTRWRVVWSRRLPAYTRVGLVVGDVTGDGHSDVFLDEWNGGTGYCGFRRLVAWAGGRERTLFARSTCETQFRIARGALQVTEPVGPCPIATGSAHCFGGRALVTLRWRGAKLVARTRRVTCDEPRLDPSRDCVRRR